MKRNGSRDRNRKKKKNPQAVRNQRVIIFTFVIVLALMFQSNHWKLEKERLAAAVGGIDILEQGKALVDQVASAGGKRKGDVPERDGTLPGEDCPEDDGGETDGEAPGSKDIPEGRTLAGGDVLVEGDALAEGDVLTEGDALARGDVLTEGDALAGGDVPAEGDTLAGGDVSVEGDIQVEGETSDSLMIHEEDLWCLILTNARYPVPDDYEVELAQVPGSNQSVDARIYEPLMAMFDAMKEEGLHPVVCSGYRTLDKQEKLFNRKVQSYVKSGYTMDKANEMARQVLSIPGSGEHCLGLAVDIFASSYRKLEVGFEKTPEGKWLREHSQDYGFTLRYEKGKEEVTGIQYEPWHFRYVGVKVARYLKEHQLSLEEFYIEQSLYG